MDTNLKNNQYQKALNFLEEGCSCDCYTKIPQEEFAELRVNFQSLSKKEQDAFVMAQLLNTRGGKTAFSPRLKNQERTNYRSFYQWDHNTPICLETYLNMLGISHVYLECIRKHLKDKNLITRIHGNNENKPQWKTKTNVDQEIKETVKSFLENCAEEYGLPDPGKIRREKYSLILLPSEMTYKSVHRDFLDKYIEYHKFKFLKYETFRRLWHKTCPHIKFQSPRSDLCDTCQKFKHELAHSCLDEVAKKELKKNF